MKPRHWKKSKSKGRGVYLLPNLITSASLFCGFYSILSSIKGAFPQAAIFILVSVVLDALDGRIARWTKATSSFGVEYDSLSDLIAFGMAPSILVYYWALLDLGRLGWIGAFAYLICGALRLARFNIQKADDSLGDCFKGLPTPGAAIVIASTVIFFHDYNWEVGPYKLGVFILNMVLAFLMVSTVKYPAFKKVNLMGSRPFDFLVTTILFLLLILYNPQLLIPVIAYGYLILGPTYWILTRKISPSKFFSTNTSQGQQKERSPGLPPHI